MTAGTLPTPLVGALAGLLLLPLVLALFRRWPRAGCALAALACVVPFLVPTPHPLVRAGLALLTWVYLVKSLQYAAGHERPGSLTDFLQFVTLPVVVRWDAPRRPDPRRALASLGRGLALAVVLGGLVHAAVGHDLAPAVRLVVTEVGVYVALAALCNVAVVPLALRGLDYDDPFDSPLLARSPAEFWGRRWNSWVSHMLYRYVFTPAGGRRHPVRGTLAAFAASAALHEALVDVGIRGFSGWMGLFFLVQGALVVATSRWPAFRRQERRRPVLTWGFTLAAMLTTGVLFVRGMDGADPFRTWDRIGRRPEGVRARQEYTVRPAHSAARTARTRPGRTWRKERLT